MEQVQDDWKKNELNADLMGWLRKQVAATGHEWKLYVDQQHLDFEPGNWRQKGRLNGKSLYL